MISEKEYCRIRDKLFEICREIDVAGQKTESAGVTAARFCRDYVALRKKQEKLHAKFKTYFDSKSKRLLQGVNWKEAKP